MIRQEVLDRIDAYVAQHNASLTVEELVEGIATFTSLAKTAHADSRQACLDVALSYQAELARRQSPL